MSESLRALVVDWGGVLTGPMAAAVRGWAAEERVDLEAYSAIMGDWFGDPIGQEARLNPVHAHERGEMELPDVAERLAVALTERTGRPHASDGLLRGVFDRLDHAPEMSGLVRRAHAAGLTTALLSNSWGNNYPRDGWDEMFDAVVISGEVGMRKPEPQIYEHTCALLGLSPAACVFVDDVVPNVRAAVSVGMVGIHHTSYEQTSAEVDVLFGLALA